MYYTILVPYGTGVCMNKESIRLMNQINTGIIKCRNVYASWAKMHNISYHEMLVFYTIREYGYCSQKQICDSYILPKQTIHNVISKMLKKGLLVYEKDSGKEKIYKLSPLGKKHYDDLLKPLNVLEDNAIKAMGKDKMNKLINLLLEFDKSLNDSLRED